MTRAPTPEATLAAVVRRELPRVIGGLARMLGDVGRAEELAQDAVVAALERWPAEGVPDNPGAWLMTAAKNRALDELRRRRTLERKHALVGAAAPAHEDSGIEARIDDDVGDDLLRLMFVACHPVLATEARVALTLRLLGGLTTSEIARAFLVPEPTIAQRIVRAKRTLGESGVPFALPHGEDRAARLSAVLSVLYLVFNEGYAASSGDDVLRPALCDEALRLTRVLSDLAPREPEVFGLLALCELQSSRSAARVGPDGQPVLLLEQDRSRWDALRIARGLAALERAQALGGRRGPYALQAAIAACHAVSARAEDTPFERIAALYGELAEVMPSPVVELNRAVALGMAFGPAAGLALVIELERDPALSRYHWLPSVKGDLLAKLGRLDEARAELVRAASLTDNARDQAALRERAAGLGPPPPKK